MTREEAHKAAEVMLAYADGKEIEFLGEDEDGWESVEQPTFDWDCNKYRVKVEPHYRPFNNAEECWNEMQKHQPFGWLKDKGSKGYAVLCIVGNDKKKLEDVFSKFTFADGEPFGVKED